MTFCLRKNIEFKIKYITFEISNRWLYLIKKYKLIKFSNTVIRFNYTGQQTIHTQNKMAGNMISLSTVLALYLYKQ